MNPLEKFKSLEKIRHAQQISRKKSHQCVKCMKYTSQKTPLPLSFFLFPLRNTAHIGPYHLIKTEPEILFVTIDQDVSFPWLVKKYKDKILCQNCLMRMERRYILDHIPQEDLPLHINDTWITELGENTYKLRLGYPEMDYELTGRTPQWTNPPSTCASNKS